MHLLFGHCLYPWGSLTTITLPYQFEQISREFSDESLGCLIVIKIKIRPYFLLKNSLQRSKSSVVIGSRLQRDRITRFLTKLAQATSEPQVVSPFSSVVDSKAGPERLDALHGLHVSFV